jgi:hypothetical protein
MAETQATPVDLSGGLVPIAPPSNAPPSGAIDLSGGLVPITTNAPQGSSAPALTGPALGASQATSIGPRPSGTWSSFNNWLDDVQGDVKNGTDATWVGNVLRKMGAKGTDYGVAPGAASLAPVGALTGIPKVLQAAPELVQGHPVRAVNKALGGAMETLGPLAVTQPEAMVAMVPGMAASHLAAKTASHLGADDDTAELVGNVAGLVAGGASVKKTHVDTFAAAVNSKVAADYAFNARTQELARATDQAKAAGQKAQLAAEAEAVGKGTPEDAIAAQNLHSAAIKNATVAQEAFKKASDLRDEAAARVESAHGLINNSLTAQAANAASDIAGKAVAPVTGPVGRAIESVGGGLQDLAAEPMNSLLRANKKANYLYGKNPGQAFIDEGIKIPKDSVTLGGQLENLHGQLESAQNNLSQQLNKALSEPSVAAKRLDIVPTVTDAVADAKKFIARQTGLDVPKYTEQLNKLQDSILTRYDEDGNPVGKITETKLSPVEVADVKRSLGKNTQWRVLPTDPDLQLKTYLNSVRKRIYGQLADTVEEAAPNADVKQLNQRLANSIEAQGLLENRIAYEHGTGGYNAAARKAELFGGLIAAIVSPEPITKSLGAAAVADRALRSVAGRMITAKGLNAAGKGLSKIGEAIQPDEGTTLTPGATNPTGFSAGVPVKGIGAGGGEAEAANAAKTGLPEGTKVAAQKAAPEAVGLHEDDLPYRAKYQDVDFESPDLQDSVKKVTPASIKRDYAPKTKVGQNASVYKAYIPMEEMPSPEFVEPEEENFDRMDYRPRGAGSPVKVLVKKNGSLQILDGNHRTRVWEEQNQQYAPAWVVDERGSNIENLSEDEKSEREEAEQESREAQNPNIGAEPTAQTPARVETVPVGDKTQAEEHPSAQAYHAGNYADAFQEGIRNHEHEITDLELRDEGVVRNNASGGNAASLEAISRLEGQKARGEQVFRVNTANNTEIPIPRGVDAVDAKAGPYDEIVLRDKNGNETVLDRGERAKMRRDRISTRVPTAVKATENALEGEPLVINRAAVDSAPGLAQKMADKVRNYDGVKVPANVKDPAKVLDKFQDHIADNLRWIYDQVPEEQRTANAKWYESANRLANDMAEKHGMEPRQGAGVIASMSPQKDWDMNVSLAQRAADIHHTQGDFQTTPEMMAKGKELSKKSADMKTVLNKLNGKTYSQLTNPYEKAAWVRIYDETYNPRDFHKIDPGTGNAIGLRTNVNGQPSKVAWGSLNEGSKAVSIMQDGSRENISNQMGGAHKVRNFYNNLIDPTNDQDVTIDTHAVAAGHMQPFSGNSPEGAENFGGSGSNMTGVSGTYPLYADAYRKVAGELGIKPRELQSVVWEWVRDRFTNFKTEAGLKFAEGQWAQAKAGKITADQARQAIADEALKAKQASPKGKLTNPHEAGILALAGK